MTAGLTTWACHVLESPYIVTRSEGMVHLRLRSNPKDCLGCCRLDVYELLWAMAKQEALAEVQAALEKATP